MKISTQLVLDLWEGKKGFYKLPDKNMSGMLMYIDSLTDEILCVQLEQSITAAKMQLDELSGSIKRQIIECVGKYNLQESNNGTEVYPACKTNYCREILELLSLIDEVVMSHIELRKLITISKGDTNNLYLFLVNLIKDVSVKSGFLMHKTDSVT